MAIEGQPDQPTVDYQPEGGLAPGTKIKDRYRIEKQLGRGGFGLVYLARDEQLHDRAVVVKVLLLGGDPKSWQTRKFREEREALARIDHPGVVGVLDAGETAGGKPFLVMQYVDGVTLRVAQKTQAMPLRRVAHIVRRIAQALSAAHERGVVHRDLKPENVMLQDLGDGEEVVKIIDFGIATVKESQAAASPEITRVAGSGPYMSPEHLLGKPAAASDIYSLGVMAYELVTGRRPWETSSPAQQHQLQREGVKAKPRELRPEVPAAAEASILKALSFDAGQRHTRARDFGEEFARAVAPGPAEPRSEAVKRGRRFSASDLRRERVLILSLILVALAVLGMVVAARARERTFTYAFLGQKYREGAPVAAPFVVPGEMIFQADHRLRLVFSSPQAGFLYILNEGPVQTAGLPSFNIIFPGAGESTLLEANREIRIPDEDQHWLAFDEQQGTEKLWMIWTAEKVPELEAATRFATAQHQGVIEDPVLRQSIRALLEKHHAKPPVAARDEAKKQTTVRGRGAVLVRLMKLEHQ